LHGIARTPLTPKAVAALEGHGSVRRIVYYSSGHVILFNVHRSSAELGEVMGIMEDECFVDAPEALLVGKVEFIGFDMTKNVYQPAPSMNLDGLKPIDFAIISSLSKDARKPVNKVAEELGVSSKMVNRRLSKLIQSGAMSYAILIFPSSYNDLMFVLRVHLDSRHGREAFLARLSGLGDHLDHAIFFDNSARLVFIDGYASSVEEFNSILETVAAMPEVESVYPDIPLKTYFIESWLEREVQRMAAQSK
jgi:DNA-binding Lrp family transcriptional regulator